MKDLAAITGNNATTSGSAAARNGLTPQETAQVQLARWQRALELYVYAPQPQDQLGMLELLEHLSEGIAEVRPILLQNAAIADCIASHFSLYISRS